MYLKILAQQYVIIQILCVCVYLFISEHMFVWLSIHICLSPKLIVREKGNVGLGEHFPNAKLPIFSAIEAPLFEVLTQVYICHLT